VAYFSFENNDIVRNTLVSRPSVEFYIYQREVFFDNSNHLSGSFTGSVPNAPNGYINLFEHNIDRTTDDNALSYGTGLITPFVYKGGKETAFKTLSKVEFNQLDEGSIIYGKYPLISSISRQHLRGPNDSLLPVASHTVTSSALQNIFNHYSYLGPHYLVAREAIGETAGWNKTDQTFSLINVPSIFYGSSIEKGTVELNFYIAGSLVGQLKDVEKDGRLIQVSGTANDLDPAVYGSGSTAGLVLYNEGFLYLTGSWKLHPTHEEPYRPSSTTLRSPTWLHFGVGANEPAATAFANNIPSSSFGIKFSGSMETQVMTMFATAPMGMLNHSNNYTYTEYSQSMSPITSSTFFAEPSKRKIKNVVSGAYTDLTESFSKETYISKVKIYDEDMNCIGIAKVATPVKKTLQRDLTFKLKLDI
tara:strand:- start:171 stop:1424 length:1254 start_codon:yes stop_codon:yes gene_type:complete